MQRTLRGWDPAPYVFVAAVAVTATALTLARAGLFADGSGFAIEAATRGRPYVANGRALAGGFQLPAVLALRLGGGIPTFTFLFTLGYAVVPPVVMVACARATRGARRFLVWPALWLLCACATFPLYVMAEFGMASALAWTVLLVGLVRPTPRRLALATVPAVLIYLLHPTATLLLGACGAGALLRSSRAGDMRRWLAGWGALLLLAAAWRSHALSGYERDSATSEQFLNLLHHTGGALQLAGALVLVLGGAILASRFAAGRAAEPVAKAVVALLAVGAAVSLVVLSSDEQQWGSQFNIRSLVPSACTLLLLLASVDLWHASREPRPQHRRRREPDPTAFTSGVVAALAVVAAACVVGQAWGWNGAVHDVRAGIEAGCSPPFDVTVPHPSTNTWTITPLSVMVQGDRPVGVLVPDCTHLVHLDDAIELDYIPPIAVDNEWLDLRALHDEVVRQTRS